MRKEKLTRLAGAARERFGGFVFERDADTLLDHLQEPAFQCLEKRVVEPEAYMEVLFTTYWEEGISVQEYDAIRPLVERLGLDPEEFCKPS